MKRRTKTIIAAAALGTVVAAGAGIAAAGSEDDGDRAQQDEPIPGTDLRRASEAALAHTGGGRVTETEVGDEQSFYEVEVTLDDGSQVDVQLDEQFKVVGDERDGDQDDE
ncbi:MAG TPA: hypothetical protein VFU44_01395 [Candidatus Limnocylindria bacterium]|jgi:uncharacterized membrane protein YkoI|nr:hypothetical protein [Candidatus Limnocylindria bacterium]